MTKPPYLIALIPVATLLAGCDDQQAPPMTVVVNTPPADAGLSVLLTVMVAVAFIALVLAGLSAWAWASERRARRDTEHSLRIAEDTVLAFTGYPVEHIHLTATHVRRPSRRPAVADGRRPARTD
jgi:heme/copper-type cytochrome/quinol oxidase subunit 2